MVGYWDSGLRNRFANAAYLTFFGIGPDEMAGMHISDLLGAELFQLNQPFIVRALTGEEQLFERVIPDPQGGPARYTQASYIPHARDGRVLGFVALVTDITRREQAERRVRELEHTQREVLEWMVRSEEIDRDRIAGQLHDDTVQVLAGLQVQLGRISRAIDVDSALGRRLVVQAQEMVSQAADETRRLMFDLRPQRFAEHGLRGVITQLVERAASQAAFEWTVEIPDTRFPGIVEQLVFRTVREAVLNAQQHSRASTLTVTISADQANVRGTITDDGVGFETTAAETPGRFGKGLAAADQRLRLAGGQLTVESRRRSGCSIRFTVPIQTSTQLLEPA